jgi:hypothetical protein
VGSARRVGGNGEHVALKLLRGTETFDAIAFGTPADRPLPEEGSLLDVVGTLERDTFQGEARLRIRALDYASAAASPLRARRLQAAIPVAIGAAAIPAS